MYFICSAYALLIFLLGPPPSKRPKKAAAEGKGKGTGKHGISVAYFTLMHHTDTRVALVVSSQSELSLNALLMQSICMRSSSADSSVIWDFVWFEIL